LDQLVLGVPFDLDLVWTRWLRAVINSRLQSFDDESFSDPRDRFQTGADRCDNFIVRVTLPVHAIRQQQNTGMGQLATGGLAAGNQLFQSRTSLRNQSDTILSHRSAPLPEMHPASEWPQEKGTRMTRQSEIDRTSEPAFNHLQRSISRRHSTKSPVNRRLTAH
jgi:hypothetical protein